MPSPPGQEEELMEFDTSLMTVSLGRRYASKRFRLASRTKRRRKTGRFCSLAAGKSSWLERKDAH